MEILNGAVEIFRRNESASISAWKSETNFTVPYEGMGMNLYNEHKTCVFGNNFTSFFSLGMFNKIRLCLHLLGRYIYFADRYNSSSYFIEIYTVIISFATNVAETGFIDLAIIILLSSGFIGMESLLEEFHRDYTLFNNYRKLLENINKIPNVEREHNYLFEETILPDLTGENLKTKLVVNILRIAHRTDGENYRNRLTTFLNFNSSTKIIDERLLELVIYGKIHKLCELNKSLFKTIGDYKVLNDLAEEEDSDIIYNAKVLYSLYYMKNINIEIYCNLIISKKYKFLNDYNFMHWVSFCINNCAICEMNGEGECRRLRYIYINFIKFNSARLQTKEISSLESFQNKLKAITRYEHALDELVFINFSTETHALVVAYNQNTEEFATFNDAAKYDESLKRFSHKYYTPPIVYFGNHGGQRFISDYIKLEKDVNLWLIGNSKIVSLGINILMYLFRLLMIILCIVVIIIVVVKQFGKINSYWVKS
jgi:hypothetical protein